ncbi:hypothetical protein G9A89_018583 [Geosiphon pyriformis]|nr:hypothetical protein G9A89_018583 [Geosiphon pyriformis]
MSARSDHDALVDMGFEPEKVVRALKATGGLQSAMDWLLAHPGDLEETPEPQTVSGPSNSQTTVMPERSSLVDEGDEIQDGEQTAQSLQCNDCQRLLRDASAAERHAIKTGHVNFSESTTAIKPLTEEEKAEKLQELKQRLMEKREIRLLAEKEEEKNREKVRRKSGRELTDAKEKFEEKDLQKTLIAKKKEKEEERIAKAKIKAQIEADKRDRAAKREAAKQSTLQTPSLEVPSASSSTPGVVKEYSETRLQIRRQDGGTPFTQTFQSSDTLGIVYDYVGKHITHPFRLMTTFPRKVLDRINFENKTLKELDLGIYPVKFECSEFNKPTNFVLQFPPAF